MRDYAERQSEAAFAAIVRRYVDLVYSAALRLSCDADTAKDVTQGVFVALAQNAQQLADRPALAGWLHTTARNLSAKTIRSDARRRVREQEAVGMNRLLSANPDASWEHIAPHLDEALGELSEPDRDAVLLRYFKNHDLRTVGATLGISDDAAQKRVSRAVERLREFFSKRGVTVGASGLAVVISSNAVQAAPVGLALTISTAAVLTGTTLATTATVTATKAIAMTALQKTIVTATIAALAGVGIYEARQASQLREQVQTLQQQQALSPAQIQQSQNERDDATNRLATLAEELAKSNSNSLELLRLRGEVGVLRQQTKDAEEKLAAALSYTAKFTKDENATAHAMKNLQLVMMQWALDHDEKFATNLTQLANELKKPYVDTNTTSSIYSFDFVNAGVVTPKDPKMLIFRERFARQAPDGTWRRIYGFADGRAITAITTDGNFDAWEKVNTESPPQK